MANAIWGILWFFVLVLVVFWLAPICAYWYILLACFGACIDCMKKFTDMLLEGVKLPYTVTKNMIDCKKMC